ncbi:MAG: hypothetical protein HY855_11055 [Burkholderiales bacterium]|nr:hypothetical protein [Burkholderiales bacterium]
MIEVLNKREVTPQINAVASANEKTAGAENPGSRWRKGAHRPMAVQPLCIGKERLQHV